MDGSIGPSTLPGRPRTRMRGFAVGSDTLYVQRINELGRQKWQAWEQVFGPNAEAAVKMLNERLAAAQRTGMEIRMTRDHPGHARVEVHEETGQARVWVYEPGKPGYFVVLGRFTGMSLENLMKL